MIFLTLLSKLRVNAQSLLASNYSINSNRHDSEQFDRIENGHDYPEAESYKPDYKPVTLSTIYRAQEDSYTNSSSNYIIKNNCKIYPRFHPRFLRLYTTNVENSVRLTFKPFKVIITPLWK